MQNWINGMKNFEHSKHLHSVKVYHALQWQLTEFGDQSQYKIQSQISEKLPKKQTP